jgi:hypothetical protein
MSKDIIIIKLNETYFFIDNNMNLDSLLRFALQYSIEPPFRKEGRRTTKIKLRSKPPILNANI